MDGKIVIESLENMPNMVLKFKAKNVAKFEKETGKSIFDAVQESDNVDNVCKLIAVGNNDCCIEDAYEILDDWLASGGTFQVVSVQIVKALERDGFLARDLGMSLRMIRGLRETMTDAILEMELQELN